MLKTPLIASVFVGALTLGINLVIKTHNVSGLLALFGGRLGGHIWCATIISVVLFFLSLADKAVDLQAVNNYSFGRNVYRVGGQGAQGGVLLVLVSTDISSRIISLFLYFSISLFLYFSISLFLYFSHKCSSRAAPIGPQNKWYSALLNTGKTRFG